MFKRLCSLILSVGMLLGMLPASLLVGATETAQEVPSVLTAYSAAAIDIDGKITEDGWLLIHKVGQAGSFGAQWQRDKLYLAVAVGNATQLELTLAGKTVRVQLSDLTVSGDVQPDALAGANGIVELSVAFDKLAIVPDYDAEISLQVKLDSAAYTGKLCLSAVDWFATENSAHPISARLTGSSKVAGSDVATENQKAVKIDGGYRIHDLYSADGANPVKLRTYALFDNIGSDYMVDRGFGLYLEFDFHADSMPVYTEATATKFSPFYGSYGFAWNMSTAFNESRAANTLCMGIYNTADGLVFALSHSGGTTNVPLQKKVGDTFRVGCQWQGDGDLVLFVDGAEITTVKSAHKSLTSFMNKAVVFSTIRNGTAAASKSDDLDVTVTNVAVGKLVASAEKFVPEKGTASPALIHAAQTPDTITLDGLLTEADWLVNGNLMSKDGYIMGTFGALWRSDAIYLALDPNRSAKVGLTLNGKTAVISTENLSVSGDFTVEVARSDADDLLEIKVPFTELEMDTPQYDSALSIKLELENGSYSGDLWLTSVDWLAAENTQHPFVGRVIGNSRQGGDDTATKNQSVEKISGGYRLFDLYDANGENPAQIMSYITGGVSGLEKRGYGFHTEFDFCARSMPVYTAAEATGWSRYYAVYGFNWVIAEAYVEGKANVVRAGIFNSPDGLICAVKGSAGDVLIPLGKQVGDRFRIGSRWQADGDLELYLDGVLIQTVGSAHVQMSGFMSETTSFDIVRSDKAAQSAADDMDIALTNVAVGKLMAYSEKYEPVADSTAPGYIHTAFSFEDIFLDGSIAEHGWVMNGRVLDAEGLVVGTFGARWQADRLYMAIDPNNAKTVTVSLCDKEFSFAVADLKAEGDITPTQLVRAEDNDTLELVIPFEDLGITITDYNTCLPVKVMLDTAAYAGKLKLTSMDWFATDNEVLNLHAASVGSASQGVLEPTANQGCEALKTGWRLYDLYDPQGNNPDKIRNYVILWRDSIYDPLGDRSLTSYAEFDLQVDSMPVYTASEAVGWSNLMACHGFSWWLADNNNGTRFSNSVSLGVYNSVQGLVLVALRNGDTPITFRLNRQVGDKLRLGTAWRKDGSVTVYLDGEEFVTIENVEVNRGSYGSMALGFNLVRSDTVAACASDSMDISVTEIAIGKSYDDSLLDAVTWERIRGENEAMDGVTDDLVLPRELSNPQLTEPRAVTWTSSDPAVITAEGRVIRPATGFREVTLTATLADGTSKSFRLVVAGIDNSSGNVLVVEKDYDPAVGAGAQINGYAFTLDENNKSVIVDLQQKQAVSVAVLTDGDSASRLNESVLTLWVSDDNVTYTQVKGFKLLHLGNRWYLYDFTAEGRYVKVHCTHFDGTEADFTGPISGMLDAYDDPYLAWGGTFTETGATLTNITRVTRYDWAWTLEGVQAQRVLLNGEILYHYTENGNTVVRVPCLEAGETVNLTVLSGNADAPDLSNREYVYEVSYGTREARPAGGEARMMLALPNGTIVSIMGNGLGTGMSRTFSYDGGRTWTEAESLACTLGFIAEPGGFIYDSVTGRIFFQGCFANGFVAEDKEKSDGKVGFIYSDDNGVTWKQMGYLNTQHTYALSYSDGVMLSCYDGMGPNVDFVLNVHVQYNNTGSFCCTVAYTTDAGNTWQTGESMITFGSASGFEGGVSEATILERDDGSLVLYARCQFADSDHFAQSYSYDHGITWVEDSKHTQVYTGGTQPIFYRYEESPLLFWGGNHMQGGTSGIRAPYTVGVSYDGMETVENMHNLYLKYSLQGLSAAMQNRVTNPVVQKVEEDTLISTWWCQGRVNTTVLLRVEDFTDYLYRTKGVYDSFEHGTVRYEGWDTVVGSTAVSDAYATEGSFSMEISDATTARSIPYLQSGTVSMDVYCPDDAVNFTLELQSAFTVNHGEGAPVGLRVESGSIIFNGEDAPSGLTLRSGWNRLELQLELDAGKATLSVNGGTPVEMPVNTEIGNYACYLVIANNGTLYLDDLLVLEDRDAQVYTQSAAGAVMRKIAAIGTVTPATANRVRAARESYEALGEAEKARVTNLADLEEAEAALELLRQQPTGITSYSISLKGNIGLNVYMTVNVDQLEEGYLCFTRENGTQLRVPVEAAQMKYDPDTGAVHYVFSIPLSAKEMNDTVEVQFFCGTEAVTQPQKYSIAAYAYEILEDATGAYDEVKPLVEAMLHYGAAAQVCFGHNTEELANAGLDQVPDYSGITAETLAPYAGTGSGSDDAPFYGSSLLLKSETSLRFFFQVAEGASFTATYAGEAMESNIRCGLHYVTVENISAKDLDEMITIVANGSEVTASALTYAYNVLSAAEGTYSGDLITLVKALYAYNQAANAYFGE